MKNLVLKSIKHSAFASQETYCYEANLYLNGKKIAEVGNQGFGGSDYQHVVKGKEAEFQKVVEHFKSLPAEEDERFGFELQPDLELWCTDQVANFLISKDLKRALKKSALYVKGGEIRSVKIPKGGNVKGAVDYIKSKNPKAVVLNELPFEKALVLWRENA